VSDFGDGTKPSSTPFSPSALAAVSAGVNPLIYAAE